MLSATDITAAITCAEASTASHTSLSCARSPDVFLHLRVVYIVTMGDASRPTNGSEPAYLAIARRKLNLREEALHTPSSISIRVPTDLLPTDPLKSGDKSAQNVSHIPSKLLDELEIEIASLSIPALLSRIRSGRYTSSIVTAAYIRRASITHQLTNCVTEPLFTRALSRAADLDKFTAQNNGATIGPLHGLPVSVKDTFNVAGYDSTIGLASLCFSPAKTNAPLVDLLESLGAIVIAKTNVPQTMASLDSVNNVFGRTMNPFNRRLTAGGSSGGEGVLVAMGGSAIGFGTDVGGSIRIPAMCNGIYGVKPSVGRVPFGGQQGGGQDGMGRVGVQAVAGPVARSMEDINIVMQAILPEAWKFGEDCTSMLRSWPINNRHPSPSNQPRFRNRPHHGSGPHGEFTIGILRSDNNTHLLPPIARIIDETAQSLRQHAEHLHLRIVDLPTPPAWQKSQSLMSKLMGLDGGATMSKLLLDTDEPLVPWMQTRFKHNGKPQSLTRAAELQSARSQLEKDLLSQLWGVYTDPHGRRHRRVDAVVCPLAPHPVPEIERYNAVGYTSSWVLFDYPAGTVPVREMREEDLELGVAMDKENKLERLGSWDERSRELWDEKCTDRRVYLGSKLSVQCVTGRGEDEKLLWFMGLVDGCVKRGQRGGGKYSKAAGKI